MKLKRPKEERFPCIDFSGPEGLEIDIVKEDESLFSIAPRKGFINKREDLTRNAFCLGSILSDPERILLPKKRVLDQYVTISFEEAFQLIYNKIKEVKPEENVFFGGARLSNEELYLLQKWVRAGVKSNAIDSFHYMYRQSHFYNLNKNDNVQWEELSECGRLFLIGGDISIDTTIYFDDIQSFKEKNHLKMESVTIIPDSPVAPYCDLSLLIENYYFFVKAAIYYVLSKGKESGVFVEALHDDFQQFKSRVLAQDYKYLLRRAKVKVNDLESWVERYLAEPNAVIISFEREVSAPTVREMMNLQMITGKLGAPSSGLVLIKEKNNSQGLFDMGICPERGVGYREFTPEYVEQVKALWRVQTVATEPHDILSELQEGKFRNMFIFGEDPLGCDMTDEIAEGMVNCCDFLVVQDYFHTKTADYADLILPASFPFETGGSFTNTFKQLQMFPKAKKSQVVMNNLEQLAALCHAFGVNAESDAMEIFGELSQLFEQGCCGAKRHQFVFTKEDRDYYQYLYGCDYMMKEAESVLLGIREMFLKDKQEKGEE